MQTQHIIIVHLQPIHRRIGLQIALELVPAALPRPVDPGSSTEGAAVVEVAHASFGIGQLFEDEEPGEAGDAGDGAFVDLWEMVFSVSVLVSIPFSSMLWHENTVVHSGTRMTEWCRSVTYRRIDVRTA
jgi:hypothetical protein